jgi:hypothetical protein
LGRKLREKSIWVKTPRMKRVYGSTDLSEVID